MCLVQFVIRWIALPAVIGMIAYLAFFIRPFASKEQKGPTIEFRRELDLGDRELGEQVSYPFSISNLGDQTLSITNIQSNCSCTGMERKENGKYVRPRTLVIAPGATAELWVRISVRGAPANKEMINTITFNTNDPAVETGSINAIVRFVRTGAGTSPEKITFGSILRGKKAIRKIAIWDSAVPPRKV